MLLAIDTATRWMGLALHDGSAVVAEQGWRSGNTQTMEMAPAIERLWARAGITADELSGIAVAIGPGSYTGLRIGLGFAKGLALANGTLLVGVPTLDVIAASVPKMRRPLIVVIEAGRTRVTAGEFGWQGRAGWQLVNKADNYTWADLLEKVADKVMFTGEITAEAATMIRTARRGFGLVDAPGRVRRAGQLAELGWQRLKRGDVDSSAKITPLYLRNPA